MLSKFLLTCLLLAVVMLPLSPAAAQDIVITKDNAGTVDMLIEIPASGAVYSVAWSPFNDELVFGLADGTIHRVQLADPGVPLRPMTGHTDVVVGLDYADDGIYVVSGSWDGTARIWNVETATQLASLSGTDGVNSVAYRPGPETVIAYGTEDGVVYQDQWLSASISLPTLIGHSANFVFGLDYDRAGLLVATGAADATVRVWESDTGALMSTDSTSHTERVYDVAFSHSGFDLASVGQDGMLWIRPVLGPGEPALIDQVVDTGRPIILNAVAWTLNDDVLVVGDGAGILRLYAPASPIEPAPRRLATIAAHSDQIRDLAVSPDGTMIATAGFDNTVRIWGIASALGTPSLPSATPASAPGGFSCPGTPPTQLAVGLRGRVTFTDGTPTRLRFTPGGGIVTSMPEGTEFDVIGGPLCQDGFVWWQLRLAEGTVGWSAEGDFEDYYIEPVPGGLTPATSVPPPVAGSGMLSGVVWHDICANGAPTLPAECIVLSDGTFQADGFRSMAEPTIGNVQVNLGAGGCPAVSVITQTLTGPDGRYTFSGLSAGTYCIWIDALEAANVSALIPGGWTYPPLLAPSDTLRYYTVTIADGANVGGFEFGWDYQFAP